VQVERHYEKMDCSAIKNAELNISTVKCTTIAAVDICYYTKMNKHNKL